MDVTAARQISGAFVTHVTVLLAINLTHEMDPVLVGMIPEEVPAADTLLDDAVLIDQVIRAPRGEPRLERALQWLDQVWFALEDRAALHPLVLAELDARRDTPAIFDLDDALDKAASLLEQLARQSAATRDVSMMRTVMEAVRAWQAEPTREALLVLAALCEQARGEPDDLPSTEVIQRIRFFANEGSLLAGDYLALHFDARALLDWEPQELTELVRTRYPLMRGSDIMTLLLARLPVAANAADQVPAV